MSLLLSFALDVRECIPNLLAFLGVPERASKLGQENLRFLGPPFGNPSLSLSLFSAPQLHFSRLVPEQSRFCSQVRSGPHFASPL